MKISHEQYLKQLLKSKKIELESIKTDHIIVIAEHNIKMKMLLEQIDSIERQLNIE